MQVVKECFERVRIIKGVNYGIITNEQIELLLERYQLTEEQQRHFLLCYVNMASNQLMIVRFRIK